jgi:hypothetical protein
MSTVTTRPETGPCRSKRIEAPYAVPVILLILLFLSMVVVPAYRLTSLLLDRLAAGLARCSPIKWS